MKPMRVCWWRWLLTVAALAVLFTANWAGHLMPPWLEWTLTGMGVLLMVPVFAIRLWPDEAWN